jgi:hypothetical protein
MQVDHPPEMLGDGDPDRPGTQSDVQGACRQPVADLVAWVLDSEDRTRRAVRLLVPMLSAWVLTVIGVVAIIVLLATSFPCGIVASALGGVDARREAR